MERLLPGGYKFFGLLFHENHRETMKGVIEMLPASTERVPGQTDPAINEKIEHDTAISVMRRWESGREAVNARLEELDREWDIERAIEANAAAISLIGIMLAAFVNIFWLLLPALVAAFLLQHALQGWCPPVPVLRRLGFRTTHEIDNERYALKAIRGDFKDAPVLTEPCDGAKVARLMKSVQL
ncbi:MAG: hypothetical protein AAGU11_13735 [Syntrophobacteraceae bacterium]